MLMLLAVIFSQADTAPVPVPACVLNDAGKRANAALSFDDFDQKGTLSSSARRLGEASCWLEAADATADYLIRGPVATPRQQRILLFHLGQYVAASGNNGRAADFIAATREPPVEASASEAKPDAEALNWNDYVRGTWAFLVKDRALLVTSRDAVLASPGGGNANDGAFLAGLERCFDRPYAIAYNRNCGR